MLSASKESLGMTFSDESQKLLIERSLQGHRPHGLPKTMKARRLCTYIRSPSKSDGSPTDIFLNILFVENGVFISKVVVFCTNKISRSFHDQTSLMTVRACEYLTSEPF